MPYYNIFEISTKQQRGKKKEKFPPKNFLVVWNFVRSKGYNPFALRGKPLSL